MYVARTVRSVNPRAPAPSVSVGNPAWMLTLGPVNPKSEREGTVAKHHKKASGHHAVSHHKKITMSQNRFLSLMGKKKAKKHRTHSSGNPFAKSISMGKPQEVAVAAAGVLVGVAAVKAVAPMLPATITSSNLYSTLAAVVIAGGVWWIGSMINPEFGAAAGLGGIAEAGSIALNAWLPSVGAPLSLGDFVPGSFTVPQTPVDVNSVPYTPSRRSFAYGGAYRVAAA